MKVGSVTKIEHLGGASYRVSGVNRCLGGSADWSKVKIQFVAAVQLGDSVHVACRDKAVELGLERRLRAAPELLTPERAAAELGFTFKMA